MPLLLWANALLLTLLLLVTLGPFTTARAQPADAPQRARGQYAMVRSDIGQSSDVVYLLDAANQEIIALVWERDRLQPLGWRNLESDATFKEAR